jgi:hypothetical protein
MKVVSVVVTFENGDLIRAKFTFGLSRYSDFDNSNDDDNDDNYINSKYNTIRLLRIQFIK